MCDSAWLTLAALLAGTPLDEPSATRLAAELGEDREVLPHLLLIRGGFAGWPAARAALHQASKAVIRPRALSNAGAAGAPERRAGCMEAIQRALSPASLEDAWAADAMIGQRPRLSMRHQPNDFIGTE